MDTKIKCIEMTTRCPFKWYVILAPSSPHFFTPETHVSVPEKHQSSSKRKKHKTYQTVGWSFLRKNVRAFHFDLFFFSSFRNRPGKLLHPIKIIKHKATQLSSPENNLQWKLFLSGGTEWQINIKNAESQMLRS